MGTPHLLVAPPQGPAVYGVLLNDRATHLRLASMFHAAPYQAPPQAPVLYLKPRHTQVGEGATVCIPAVPGSVEINATIALVLGRQARRVSVHAAPAHVAAYRIVCDLSLPHESLYRPAIRERCRDGFLPMGPAVPAGPGVDPARAEAVTYVNGVEVDRRGFARLVRPPAQLLADVTAFMTLRAGDMLLLGAADASPLARPGDAVRVEIGALGALSFRVALEPPVPGSP